MATENGEIAREIKRRRTFAIISHPDAGKTTLTEKLLLYGGAIHIAGEVKAKKSKRSATSDWMAIEKERGISVASSVMQLEHRGCRFNLLDTPGHNDFSEDTYRTLTAADCAVMLIDVAKGVEPQTIKLFQVCRQRQIPIVTFVNKLDREGKPPLDLLDEIEQVLGIPASPLTWPAGMGKRFYGVFDREEKNFIRFARDEDKGKRSIAETTKLDDAELLAEIDEDVLSELKDDLELLEAAGNPFDMERFLRGEVTPVFFGSAMNNFGVEPFLDRFIDLCPSPLPRPAKEGDVDPESKDFSGFVFKIQANMDPRHRDRIAFVRVCSGKFQRGMKVKHVRTGRKISLDRSLQFLAQERSQVEEAFAGDILGLWDPGILRIGDTLTEAKNLNFVGMPAFSPEFFVRVRPKDPMKRKQLQKGVEQLTDEGAVQLFKDKDTGSVEPIMGAVGWLQIEVVKHRLQNEYGVDAIFEQLPFKCARWVFGEDESDVDLKKLVQPRVVEYVRDVEDRPLLLFDSEWTQKRAEQKYPDLAFVASVQPGRRRK